MGLGFAGGFFSFEDGDTVEQLRIWMRVSLKYRRFEK